MLQRVVSLLLIACLLLNPSATCAHSHGEFTGEGHGARPHIHLAGKSSTAGHDDKHDHLHHLHSHHERSYRLSHVDKYDGEPAVSPRTSESKFCPLPIQHDADCIYVVDVVAAGLDRTSFNVLKFGPLPSFDLTRWNCLDLRIRIHAMRSDWPPPLLLGACPLYLRNLSLLI